jgi:hypothetical protein
LKIIYGVLFINNKIWFDRSIIYVLLYFNENLDISYKNKIPNIINDNDEENDEISSENNNKSTDKNEKEERNDNNK